MENDSLNYLKRILDQQDSNWIEPRGYEMLLNEKMITNHNQAKVLAQIVKDLGSGSYQNGYADGRAFQAYQDGYADGQAKQGSGKN